MDNQQSFESFDEAIEFLKSPEGESIKGIRRYDGKWYRWEKDDGQFHTGHLRIFLGEKFTTLRAYGDTDKEIGEIREERDQARKELDQFKEHFQVIVGHYEAQIWVSTELGRTVADLQGRLAADGLYHFFHGWLYDRAMYTLEVHSTCPSCHINCPVDLTIEKSLMRTSFLAIRCCSCDSEFIFDEERNTWICQTCEEKEMECSQ